MPWGVSDLERSIHFYRESLGRPGREVPNRITFFETRGTRLSLSPREDLAEDAKISSEGSGLRSFTLAYYAGSPEEVDARPAEAVAAGATLVKPGQEACWGGCSGYFADPDGFLWEVAWNPHFRVEPKAD